MAEVSWSRDDAKWVLDQCRASGSLIHDVLCRAEEKLPKPEQDRIRRAYAEAIAVILIEIEVPIHGAYPELTPDYLK